MSERPPTDSRSSLMETFCERILPNCHTALRLAETGCERPLNLAEQLALRYHGQLCPFCSCKRLKLDSLLEEMRQKRG